MLLREKWSSDLDCSGHSGSGQWSREGMHSEVDIHLGEVMKQY